MLRIKCVAVVGLLSLLSAGHSAPLSSCDSLIKPISVSSEEVSAPRLFSARRNNVTAAEMEEFNKQAECLNLPSPVFLDSKKGFCTEESLSQKTDNVTSIANDSFQAD
ncbi:hypothetical protein GBF38_000126 [Nibea albiflora]|nr:hypothetical protein GBF38_000126 [Nibea albiflora]